MRLPTLHRELVFVVLVFCLVSTAGMVYVSTWGQTPHFYQQIMGPSALWACGKDFANPAPGSCPALESFLNPEMRDYSVANPDRFAPETLPTVLETRPLDPFQQKHLYFLWSVALIWRFFGIAWSALTPLYGLLFGVSGVAVYGIFRLATPRFLAFPGALMLMVSPVQLNNLVRLRDFVKAPFILVALFFLVLMVLRNRSPRRWPIYALGCALAVGLGSGFRMDTLIVLPAFCVLLVGFCGDRPWSHWPWKACALGVFFAAFLVSSWPVMGLNSAAGNKFHYYLMGKASIYESRLGVDAPQYQVTHRYFDYEPLAMTQAYAVQQGLAPEEYGFDSPGYEQMSRALSLDLVSLFPADVITTAYAAILRTVDELGSSPAAPAPRNITNTFLVQVYRLHAHLMHNFLRYARYGVVLLLCALALYQLRLALALTFSILYFGGYSAIQFASRHYFHLQFFSLWVMLMLLTALLYVLWFSRHAEARAWWWEQIRAQAHWKAPAPWRLAIFLLLLGGGLLLPWQLTRQLQQQRVQALFEAYETSPTHAMIFKKEVRESDVFLHYPGARTMGRLQQQATTFSFSSDFLLAHCDTSQGPITLSMRYGCNVPEFAIDWSITIPQHTHGVSKLYFPIFNGRWPQLKDAYLTFEGISIQAAEAARLEGLYKVQDTQALPVCITACLGPDWRDQDLYLRFSR